jgi:excisionase family DNA binding protein
MDNSKAPAHRPKSTGSRVFTTGEVAKYCSVHFRTVIRWIERGSLKAYKLPGRGNNRIEEKEFLRFLKENNMPIPDDLQSTNKRILIVEDEKEMAAAIRRILNLAGYETAITQDGFQAGTMLASFEPALMTLDLSMPNMDGFSVLEFLSTQPQYSDLKIVVVSALNEAKLNEALAAGAHSALAKPFKKNDLVASVKALIGEADKF